MRTTPSLADAGKTVDTLFGLADRSLQGVGQLAALNLQAIKTTLAELEEGSLAALSAQTPAELVKLQLAALQAAPEKALAYGRQVKDILATMTAAQRAAVEAQMADIQAKFLEAIDAALKNAPGSENTLMLVKSAMAAVNDTYEGINKASRQVADAVDANVTTVTESAVSTTRSSLTTIDV